MLSSGCRVRLSLAVQWWDKQGIWGTTPQTLPWQLITPPCHAAALKHHALLHAYPTGAQAQSVGIGNPKGLLLASNKPERT